MLIHIYNKLSQVAILQENIEKADAYTKEAILSNQYAINDQEVINDPVLLLSSLKNSVQVLNIQFDKNQELTSLETAYYTCKKCEKIIDQHRHFYQEYEDRISFNNQVHETFEIAIEICYKLYHLTQNPKYLYKGFDYFEKSKAYTLLQSIQENQALHYADVPMDILNKEQDLKKQIKILEKKWQQAHFQQNLKSQEELHQRLFDTKQDYQQLIKDLEKKYPHYHQLKYQHYKIKVKDIQQYLNEETAFVEYFEGEKNIYCLLIQRDQTNFFKQTKTFEWTTHYQNFYDTISKKENATNEAKFTDIFRQFAQSSHQLFKSLLAPVIPHLSENITHLQIIPDGKLNYIPFDLLLKSPSRLSNIDYRKLDYLLKDFAIGYGYSATLLLDQQVGKETQTTSNYGGFAPIYPEEKLSLLEGLEADYKENKVYSIALREGLNDLPDARKSVKNIAHLMNGEAFLKEEATKETFMDSVGKFKVLHLAMHGVVDNENPLYSKLVFTPKKDSQEHLLEAADLYNMQLNAVMTVLSACNTGYGKMCKGEGVMSLSRAFTYAGCPSVIMSLWSIPDTQTAHIMLRFFKELKAGLPKDQALQKAKLAYLKDTSLTNSHPLYWAGFVPTGDMHALSFDEDD